MLFNRKVSGARRHDHITTVLYTQPSISVRCGGGLFSRRRSLCGNVSMALRCHAYLKELCIPMESVQGHPRLRSASSRCVQQPRMRTSIGQSSFTYYGPTVWNSLPFALRDGSLSLNTLVRNLKSHLLE